MDIIMNPINRRAFVKQGVIATASFAVLSGRQAAAANEKIVIGVVGLGGRGSSLAEMFAKTPNVEIAYLCDVDSRRFSRARAAIEELQDKAPKVVQDFRRVLEDKSVHAIINATPDHWHALASIMACQAGKDVYVEKPLAHNIWEGRKMVEAARKYQRVIQVGTQSRSAPYIKQAKELIASGKIGDVHIVKVFNMMQHPFQKPGPEQPVPAGLDYETWCGPAAKLPYSPNRSWLNLWEYSCGPIPGDAVHQLDLARYITGDIPYPKNVSQMGAIYALTDGRDTPDTQIATFAYDKFTLLYEASLWTPYLKKTPGEVRDSDGIPQWQFNSTRIEVLGTKGMMYVGRHGDGLQVFNSDGTAVLSDPGKQADKEHINNFLECIRTREKPIADVEQGHYSTLLCHMANCSFRSGNQQLEWDPSTETFVNNPVANKFAKRSYRAPWSIPDPV